MHKKLEGLNLVGLQPLEWFLVDLLNDEIVQLVGKKNLDFVL